jgi:indole-3-glycerol phosphate synthase/phosphoribosylanthranilate isomerase
LDLAEIADAYRGFADAVSVLTDGPYFGGDAAHLTSMRDQLDQPILCKDFFLEPYQVVEARVAGADAVLLMLSVLDDEAYLRCAAEAERWNMDVLTEVHDESEVSRAVQLKAQIIGINNRDLTTLNVDLQTTLRLAPMIPCDRIVVSESGIHSRADVDSLSRAAQTFLVGSHLMQAENLPLAVRRLMFGSVKICGLTNAEQRDAAYAAGATLGGMIFADESPRRVDASVARQIADGSPLPLVGVFVNEAVNVVSRLAREYQLAAVQLHGEESPETIVELRSRLPADCEIWKAVRVRDSIPRIEEFGADRLLLDAFEATRRGGTSQRFDWHLLQENNERAKLIVSGGIGPENVGEAQALGCGGLDVNSGVESSPGIKSPELLRQLFAALKGGR